MSIAIDRLPATHDYTLQPAAGGSLLAGVLGPVGEWREAEAGKTLVLAADLREYGYQRTREKGPATRKQFAAILAAAGVAPAVRLTPEKPDSPGHPALEVVSFDRGPGRLLGFLNDGAAACERTVVLERPWHVYNLRTREYLGQQQQWELRIASGDCQLYALLPEKLSAPVLTAPRAAKRGSDLALTIADKALAGEVLEVSATDATGKARPEYGGFVTLDAAGKAKAAVPLALNDPAGAWVVKLTAVVSGAAADAKVKVE